MGRHGQHPVERHGRRLPLTARPSARPPAHLACLLTTTALRLGRQAAGTGSLKPLTGWAYQLPCVMSDRHAPVDSRHSRQRVSWVVVP